jgi:hypothetical protein
MRFFRTIALLSLTICALAICRATDAHSPVQTGIRKSAGGILPVGFLRVAGNPQKYDNKIIGLSGYLRIDDQEVFLFNSPEDLTQGRFENAFLLGWDPKVLPALGSLRERLNEKLVYIEGVFHAPIEGKSAVPYNGYVYQMNFIRMLSAVPDTSTRSDAK